ncbi:hypothetical protein ACV337_31400, partial [Pseudomonas aeruginosa]
DVAAVADFQPNPAVLAVLHLDFVALLAQFGGEVDFIYEVRPRAFTTPSFVMRDTEDSSESRKYFRAEVHLQEGGQDYDIMGWSRDGVIGDILDQY